MALYELALDRAAARDAISSPVMGTKPILLELAGAAGSSGGGRNLGAMALLHELGCDLFQSYLFVFPMSAAAFAQRLKPAWTLTLKC